MRKIENKLGAAYCQRIEAVCPIIAPPRIMIIYGCHTDERFAAQVAKVLMGRNLERVIFYRPKLGFKKDRFIRSPWDEWNGKMEEMLKKEALVQNEVCQAIHEMRPDFTVELHAYERPIKILPSTPMVIASSYQMHKELGINDEIPWTSMDERPSSHVDMMVEFYPHECSVRKAVAFMQETIKKVRCYFKMINEQWVGVQSS